ncbi:MAG: Fibronectin type III domain protein [Firmicutes bacterium ADurb.Bin419]|nr:MAG: Fibronectin type III domain protein [Firmicutes bacterium ADurb.Bin419]
MKRRILVTLCVAIATVLVINGIGMFDLGGKVNAYQNVVGGIYGNANGIIGPDGKAYRFTAYSEVDVKDLDTKKTEKYSTGHTLPSDASGNYGSSFMKVLENGDVYVVEKFSARSGSGYVWYATNYVWSETEKKYVAKSMTLLRSSSDGDFWISNYGFVIKSGVFYVYKFTSTGAQLLTGTFSAELGGYYSGIYDDRHDLFLGKDNFLYCVEIESGSVYKSNNSKWDNTGYTKSTYPDWKELIGVNNITPSTGSVLVWNYSYTLNGKTYYAELLNNKVYFLKNSTPEIKEVSPEYKIITPDDSTIIPTVYVTDQDNENLTCKYYVDGSSTAKETKIVKGTSTKQAVAFSALSVAGWKEGAHTLKFEVSDTEKTVAKEIIINKVSLGAKADSITVSGFGTDSAVKWKQYTYKYTIGSNVSDWVPQKTYTQYSLTPDTAYSVKLEAKDQFGTTYSLTKSVRTLAQRPKVKLSNPSQNTLTLSIVDSNPNTTQYQIVVGDKYVNSTGNLTATATWITLSNKTITLKGLTADSTYQVKAKAKNSAGVETPLSNRVSGSTLSN